jgi:hypothetical protein
MVRAAYTGELRSMFPRYGAALDAWGGPSRSIDALKFGEDALRHPADLNAARLADMSENDREFAKLGVAQKLRDIADSKGPLAAEFDRLAGTKYGASSVRNQLRPFFDNDAELQKLVDSVATEVRMARKGNEILAGSPTASRWAEDTAGVTGADIVHGAVAVGTQHPAGLARMVINRLANWLPKGDPELDAQIARILSDPTVAPTIGEGGRLSVSPLASRAGNPYQLGPAAPYNNTQP